MTAAQVGDTARRWAGVARGAWSGRRDAGGVSTNALGLGSVVTRLWAVGVRRQIVGVTHGVRGGAAHPDVW